MITLSIRFRTWIENYSTIKQLTNNVIKADKLASPEIPARSNREIKEQVKKNEKHGKNGTVREIHWIKLTGTALVDFYMIK